MAGGMRWYDKLLLPAAIPAYLYFLVFKTNPNLHGIPKYLFIASRGFCLWMTLWIVLAALSWIFPFAIPEAYGYTNDEWRAVFSNDCVKDRSGAGPHCSPDGHLEVTGNIAMLLFGLPTVLLYLVAHLFGYDWIPLTLEWSGSPAVGVLYETGHLGFWWLLSVIVLFWLTVFLPLFVALGLLNLVWSKL